MSTEKDKALGVAIAKIEKDYGKGAIMKMGEASKLKIEAIPTGAFSLDLALGVGGLPRGRIVEIYGPEGGGKTTVSLHAIAEAQKKGGIAAFIDAEHALDPVYAKRIGVDINNLLISQPDYGEQALEICETLVRSGAVDIIVIDSVAALVPKVEIEGEMEDIQVGAQARLMSKALRKLTAIINKSKTVVIFINQLRMKIGVMFGNPETTPGGRALKFYSSIRLEVRAGEKIMDGEVVVGTRVSVKVVKNKVAPPFRIASFVLIHGLGVSREADIMDLALNQGIIDKAGAWYTFGANKIGQGLVNAQRYLKENPSTMNAIETKIRGIIASQKPDFEPSTAKGAKAKPSEAH
jgi:recombination protein RecA